MPDTRRTMCIVLTENAWLYSGVAAVMPDVTCAQMRFACDIMPEGISDANRVIIVVDNRIFIHGDWTAYHLLRSGRPEAPVVWLVRPEIGRLFPADEARRYMLDHRCRPELLQGILNGLTADPQSPGVEKDTRNFVLNLEERMLLRHVMSPGTKKRIAARCGVSIKTLYRLQHRLMVKSGFKSFVFMQLVYQINKASQGISDFW